MKFMKYIIYDERAITQGTDNATCLVVCNSLKEAKTYAGDFGELCPVYSYEEKKGRLTNEKFIMSLKHKNYDPTTI